MDWFSILASGLFGSLIVLGVTLWWEHNKQQQELKGRALLLFAEINDQCYRLGVLDKISIEYLLKLPDLEWESSKYLMAANLPFDDFQKIHDHYRSMLAARKFLEMHKAIHEDYQKEYIAKGEAAKAVLYRIAELDNQKLEAYNKREWLNKP